MAVMLSRPQCVKRKVHSLPKLSHDCLSGGNQQNIPENWNTWYTVYPKKYAHGFVVLCFVVVMQSFIMNSYEVFIHIHQGCFAGTGTMVRLPQCQWSKPGGYGKISQCITTTKHSKAKTLCIFLGVYCNEYRCHPCNQRVIFLFSSLNTNILWIKCSLCVAHSVVVPWEAYSAL